MVFRFKATIVGNKIFFREYEVKESHSLYTLHTFLQNDLGFSPDQMVMFRALDTNGRVKREFGLFDLGDGSMDSVTVKMLEQWDLLTLEYVYDMFKDRSLRLDFISKDTIHPKKSYPRLIAEKGKNPDQFSDNYDDFEQMIDTTVNIEGLDEDISALLNNEEK